MTVCSFPDCGRPSKCKGFCSGHYQQRARDKPLTPLVEHRRYRGRVITDTEAECTACRVVLPLDKFNKGAGAQGLSTWCNRCRVLWRYRLTAAEFDALVTHQGGRCAACQQVPELPFHVDHDHTCCPNTEGRKNRTCGQCVRGLLCGGCNRAIGLMGENAARLRAAADYLDRSRT